MTAPFTAEQIDRMELATAIGDFRTVRLIAAEGPTCNITRMNIWCAASCLDSTLDSDRLANASEYTVRLDRERQADALRKLTTIHLPEARRYL